jgi:hypothetical protein
MGERIQRFPLMFTDAHELPILVSVQKRQNGINYLAFERERARGT